MAGDEFAVVAAEEEGGTVQVAAERFKAVGGVAYAGQKSRGPGGRAGGEPYGDELEGFGEFDSVGGCRRQVRGVAMLVVWWLGGAGPGEAVVS